MICTIPELKKISVFHDGGKWPYKTIAEVKALTGADVVINGGLYNLTTRELCQTQRIDGVTLAYEPEPYVGYAWNGAGPEVYHTKYFASFDNFISCIDLLAEGSVHYPAELAGVRGRVAFGLKADGAVVIYCSKDSTADACTPEHLRAKMYAAGCVSALMLDGGGTAQCIAPQGTIASIRTPPTYICFWAKTYRVQVGAYWYKSGAEVMRRELAGKGYDGAWIVEK